MHSQTPELWGVTPTGGMEGNGVIFKTDGNGNNYSLMFDFPQESGDNRPGKTNFVETSDGKIFLVGKSNSGSNSKYGVIYYFDREENTLTSVYEFVTSEGYNPEGALTLHSDGLIYGITMNGGASNNGTIYTFNPETMVKMDIHSYGSRTEVGSNPVAELTFCSDGKFYGTFDYSGPNNNGTFYSFNPSTGEFDLLHAFESATTGNRPVPGLVEANGKIYGVTSNGGPNNYGTLFEYNFTSNEFSIVHSFDNDGGRTPYGGLALHSNGIIYGTTQSGGYNNRGVIFTLNPGNNNFTRIYDFNTQTGYYPQGKLKEDENGVFWGLTVNGGEDRGVIYSYNPATYSYSVHHHFQGYGGSDVPTELLKSADGLIYGFRTGGGAETKGLIYSLNPENDEYKVLANFFGKPYGKAPQGGLMQANNGLLYGVTQDGGMYSEGCIYEYNPVLNTIDTLFHFVDDTSTGTEPVGVLLQADNGSLYGLTKYGGHVHGGYGVLFEFDIKTKKYSVLQILDYSGTGGNPESNSLIQAVDGLIYGTTRSYSSNSGGSLFSYNIEINEIKVLHQFSGAENGSQPHGKLLQASDGKLYGTTDRGGVNNQGTLFVYDIATSTHATIHSFDSNVSGSYPKGNLIEVGEGILYGLAEHGGNGSSNNSGVLFTYNIQTQSYSYKLNLNGIAGGGPQNLTLASNGNIYGVCHYGGANGNSGTIFEYNPQINIINKKYDFDNVTGYQPRYVSLIEVGCLPSYEMLDITACNSYTVPSGDETYTEKGFYTVMDTIPNTCGVDSVITINLTLHHAPENTVDVDLCLGEGYTFVDGTQIESITHSQSHTSILTAQAHTGCDSIVIENLNVLQPGRSTIEAALCPGSFYVYADGTEVYDLQEDVTHVSVLAGLAANGCDSIITENLIVLSPIYSSFVINVCIGSSYIYADGTEVSNLQVNESHISILAGQASNGCDSVVTEQLLVLPHAFNEIEYNFCAGSAFTYADGTVVYDIQENESHISVLAGEAANGCDSIVTENLVIRPLAYNTIEHDICMGSSYTFADGTMVSDIQENQSYISVLEGQSYNGCDSIVTETLNVLAHEYRTDEYEICQGGSFTYLDGTVVNDIQDNLNHVSVLDGEAVNGCKLIVTENLSVLVPEYSSIDHSVCLGSSFTCADGTIIQDIQVSQSHVSILTGQASNGCDHIITEQLNVVSIDNTVSQSGGNLIANEQGASYQWFNCEFKNEPIDGAINQSYTPSTSGSYGVIILKNGCSVTSECVNYVPTLINGDNDNESVSVYPNPTNGIIHINLGKLWIGSKINLLDMAGANLQTYSADSKNLMVEIQGNKGIYFLEIINRANERRIIKIIKN